MPPERILVTGGNGFLGSTLVPYLLGEGYSVSVLDTFTYPSPSLLACTSYEGFKPIRGDCRSEVVLRQALQGVDWVIPLAAVVGAPACDLDPDKARSVNYQSIVTLLDVKEKNQKLIYVNTNSGYGTTGISVVCNEDTPMHPVSLYGQTKLDAEKEVLLYGENVCSFRLATVFGASPRMRLDLLVNDLVYRAVRDKSVVLYEAHMRRNYIHVFDVARLFLFALKNFQKLEGKPWNAGLPGFFTKKELCEHIQKYVKGFHFTEMDIGKDPDKRDYNVSVERLEKVGFKCCVSLTCGIRELIKSYVMMPVERFRNA